MTADVVEVWEHGGGLKIGLGIPQRSFGALESQIVVPRVAGHAFLHHGASHRGRAEQSHQQQEDERDDECGAGLMSASCG